MGLHTWCPPTRSSATRVSLSWRSLRRRSARKDCATHGSGKYLIVHILYLTQREWYGTGGAGGGGLPPYPTTPNFGSGAKHPIRKRYRYQTRCNYFSPNVYYAKCPFHRMSRSHISPSLNYLLSLSNQIVSDST